jgi:hypothetical protein
MSMLRMRFGLATVVVAGAMVCSTVGPGLSAQTAAARSKAADDADVQGAVRLFSAWLEGQIAYRGLPGVVAGVVADQDLVCSGR